MKEIIPGQMRCKLLRTGRDHRRVRLVTNQHRLPRPYLQSSCLTPYRADRSDIHPFLDTLGCNLPAESHGKCPTLLWKHEPSRPLCQKRHTHDHRQRVWWAATGTALLFSASRPDHAARKILPCPTTLCITPPFASAKLKCSHIKSKFPATGKSGHSAPN